MDFPNLDCFVVVLLFFSLFLPTDLPSWHTYLRLDISLRDCVYDILTVKLYNIDTANCNVLPGYNAAMWDLEVGMQDFYGSVGNIYYSTVLMTMISG